MIIKGMNHFENVCMDKLLDWYSENGKEEVTKENIFIVWSCETQKNCKCLISTTLKDGIYAAYTYEVNEQKLYEDIHKRVAYRCFTD